MKSTALLLSTFITQSLTVVHSLNDSRLVAFVDNQRSCPSADQYDDYSHIVISSAVTYTTSSGTSIKNTCDESCTIQTIAPDTVAICDNAKKNKLMKNWKALDKKIILNFGGVGMGSSADGDTNNCWDYCYNKDDEIADQLISIVSNQGFDGINIDYDYCYDTNGHQDGKCSQASHKYTDGKAQGFLYRLTGKLRDKLDELQESNGYLGNKYELSHSPRDEDALKYTTYFNIMSMRKKDLTFVMPKFYNGVTRPLKDGLDGSSGGRESALDIYYDLATELFDDEPEKVVFGFCINECGDSNADKSGAKALIQELMEYKNGMFACHGGISLWPSIGDAGAEWSSKVYGAIEDQAGCSEPAAMSFQFQSAQLLSDNKLQFHSQQVPSVPKYKWYVDYSTESCKADCEGPAPCGGAAEDWMTLFASPAKCCREKLGWLPQGPCKQDSLAGAE